MKTPSRLSVGQQEDRGRLVVRFLEEAVQLLEGLWVLDLGCGDGEIATALGAARARWIATDISVKALQRVRDRCRVVPEPALLCASSALELPFAASQFDLVLLNGVLEWVGKAAPDRDPDACQLRALQEVHRILKKEGWVYLAIENRYYPYWIVADPHVKIPLVAVLPRHVASYIHRRLLGRPYVTHIHSYRRLRSLVEKAGFADIEFYIPLFHYRWPLRVVPAADRRGIAREVAALRHVRKRDRRLSWVEELKFTLYRSTAFLGLSRLLFPSFVVLARRA